MHETIDEILEERGERYGSYATHSTKLELLNDTLASMENYHNSIPAVRCGARMILDKLVRAFNGDWRYLDNWVDIEGYAKLVRTHLEKIQRVSEELKEVPIEYLRDKCCDEWELRGSMSSKYKSSCWNCKFKDEFSNECDKGKDVLPHDYQPERREVYEHICDKFIWELKYKERGAIASCRTCTHYIQQDNKCLLQNFKNWKLRPEKATKPVAKVPMKACDRFVLNPIFGDNNYNDCDHCKYWSVWNVCMFDKCKHYNEYINEIEQIDGTDKEYPRCKYGNCVGCIDCKIGGNPN